MEAITEADKIVELERKLKSYEPVNTYNGLSIEQWKARAEFAESMIKVMPGGPWIERWYGSEPLKGSWIYCERNPVAHFGSEHHEQVTKAVYAHNIAVAEKDAQLESYRSLIVSLENEVARLKEKQFDFEPSVGLVLECSIHGTMSEFPCTSCAAELEQEQG